MKSTPHLESFRTGKRLIWWAAGAIVLVWGIEHSAFPSHGEPKLLAAAVRVDDIEQSVLAIGTIEPSKLLSVGAQASGRILALHVALGDAVKTGQLIAEIDPSTQLNALENAKATLEQYRAQRAAKGAALKQAELALNRARMTYAEEASSQADYEAAEATYNAIKADVVAFSAQIRQAEIGVNTARVNLGYTKVTAPFDGTVVAVVAPEGATVNAVQAAPTIVKLADLATMTVKARISEADVTRVRAGQRLYFTILGRPEQRYQSTLRFVEPAPESMIADVPAGGGGPSGNAQNTAVYYNALFAVGNTDGQLRPSMTAEVHIILRQAKHAVVIPSVALGESLPGERRIVRVVDTNGKVGPRTVRVGIDNHVDAQVLSGLAAGERVALGDPSPAE